MNLAAPGSTCSTTSVLSAWTTVGKESWMDR
jgi:hypothetical protein